MLPKVRPLFGAHICSRSHYPLLICLILSYLILHSLICRVLLLLLLLLRNASNLRNCTSYFGACMWVWYCRPPIGAHFHPTPQPPLVPQQLGEKDGSPLRGVARLCRGRRPPLGDRTRLVVSDLLSPFLAMHNGLLVENHRSLI